MNFISAMVLLAASSVVIDQPVDYKTAYERAQKVTNLYWFWSRLIGVHRVEASNRKLCRS